jgi:hypothetical protein
MTGFTGFLYPVHLVNPVGEIVSGFGCGHHPSPHPATRLPGGPKVLEQAERAAWKGRK